MHGNTKLKFYMTVAMETSNPTDEMKKMILTVKLLCRLGTELNHVQFNWSQPCFIAVSDTIVRNVPHLSGLLFQSTTHKTRSFRHLNDRANRVKRHYVKKKQSTRHIFLQLCWLLKNGNVLMSAAHIRYDKIFDMTFIWLRTQDTMVRTSSTTILTLNPNVYHCFTHKNFAHDIYRSVFL